MSKEKTLAGYIGYLFGKELYKTMTEDERERFMELLKNEELWERKIKYLELELLRSTMTDKQWEMYVEECKKENESKMR